MTETRLLLRDLFAAGDAGEVDSFAKYLHDAVIVHAPMGLSTQGLEAEKESWRKAKIAIPNLHHDFQELLIDGSTISARCIVSGTLQGTYGGLSANNRSFTIDQALFAHVRDGKIVELWEIVDAESLLRQLGAMAIATPSSD